MDIVEMLVEREKKRHRDNGFGSTVSVVTRNIIAPDFFLDFGNDSAILLDVSVHPATAATNIPAINIAMMSDCDVRQGHLTNPDHLKHILVRRFLTGRVTGDVIVEIPEEAEKIHAFPIMLKLLKITPTKE